MKNSSVIVALAVLMLASGCSSPFKKEKVAQAAPMNTHVLENEQAVVVREEPQPLKESAPKVTLAELKLTDIVKDQESIFKKLSEAKTSVVSVQDEHVLADIANRYEKFLEKNPKDLYAHILYGKFLRKVDHVDDALEVFEVADKIDGSVPVVKQQLANCYAELGQPKKALSYFLDAIDLDPEVGQYHYQMGELLYTYKYDFIETKEIDAKELEAQMLEAFKIATELSPDQWGYKMRYAEAYYDLTEPKWEEALALWQRIENETNDPLAKEMVYLHKAKVLIHLARANEALALVTQVQSPLLEKNRTQILKDLGVTEGPKKS